MQEKNEQILKDIFYAVFDLDEKTDVTSIRKIAEPKWDSLASTSIIAGIEGEFSIQLDTMDFEKMTSFAAIRQLLIEKEL